MREAAVRFMPVLVQQVDKGGVDSRLLVLALVERLEDPEGAVVTETIKALLGIRAMLGETARKYIDSLKLSERRPPIAAPPSMTVEVARPNEVGGSAELGFGIVPEELMKALHVEDWKVRSTLQHTAHVRTPAVLWCAIWCAGLCDGVQWCDVVWCAMVCCTVLFDRVLGCAMVCNGVVCYGVVCYGVVWCGVVCNGVVCNGVVRCAMVCNGVVWYGVVCYLMVCWAELCMV